MMERALAQDHPCELHSYHSPEPAITEYHHSKPVYMQNRLYGRIVFPADTWLCPTCHSNVHAWLDWLMKERRTEPSVGRLAKWEAERTYRWFLSEQGG